MKNKIFTLFTLILISSTASAADTWTGCLMVDGVGDYQASSHNAIMFHTETNSGNCTESANQFRVVNGTLGHTADTLKTTLSVLLTAVATKRKVMVNHDNVGPRCTVQNVVIGGYDGSCE